MMKRSQGFLHVLLLASVIAGISTAADHQNDKTWTQPEKAKAEDPDFAIQGEYEFQSQSSPDQSGGAQVIALGGGKFDAYLLEGGLPGTGWQPGKKRIAVHGERDGDVVSFADDKGNKLVRIKDARFMVPEANTHWKSFPVLDRAERKSTTLGAKPPSDAVVLFDGTSADAWENGKMNEEGLLLATGCTSKRKFASYLLHLEFRTPYKPHARGQARGNSGIYHSGRWETQILDSFGLEGRENECGGIYSISKPALNACLPPLEWQTYDVEFTAAKFDAAGKRTAWPRITVSLNGIKIHDNLELPKDYTTSAPITSPLTSPEGPIHLQNHGNPVVFRNIWVVPR